MESMARPVKRVLKPLKHVATYASATGCSSVRVTSIGEPKGSVKMKRQQCERQLKVTVRCGRWLHGSYMPNSWKSRTLESWNGGNQASQLHRGRRRVEMWRGGLGLHSGEGRHPLFEPWPNSRGARRSPPARPCTCFPASNRSALGTESGHSGICFFHDSLDMAWPGQSGGSTCISVDARLDAEPEWMTAVRSHNPSASFCPSAPRGSAPRSRQFPNGRVGRLERAART